MKQGGEYDLSIKEPLDLINPDLVILTDYNKIIKSNILLKKYKNKIVNIHLSYLPEFPGFKPELQAWKAKESGFAFHIINEKLDDCPILYQKRTNIKNCKSAEEIKEKLTQKTRRGIKQILSKLKNLQLSINSKLGGKDCKAIFKTP